MPPKKTLKIWSSQNNICMEVTETATRGVLCKKLLLKILEYSQENTCVRVSFWQSYKACNFYKQETPTQVFSCEYCEIFKNNYFEEHLLTAASEIIFLLFIRFFPAINFSSKFVCNLHFTNSDLRKLNICLCNILTYTCTPHY